jgi:hypothetical protein
VPVVIAAVVVVLAIVGYFAMRTMGSQSSASTDLGGKGDLAKLQNMTPQDIQHMKDEMAKAAKQRAANTQ